MTRDTLPYPDLVAALPRLRRYARALTRDAISADDLVQDTLARAWEKRRLWRIGSDLRAWLFTIMHNVHINQFSLRRRWLSELPLDGDEGTPEGFEIAVRASSLARVELAEVLAQIGKLPAEQREVLLLAAVEERSYAEIARVQGAPIGTVTSCPVCARKAAAHPGRCRIVVQVNRSARRANWSGVAVSMSGAGAGTPRERLLRGAAGCGCKRCRWRPTSRLRLPPCPCSGVLDLSQRLRRIWAGLPRDIKPGIHA